MTSCQRLNGSLFNRSNTPKSQHEIKMSKKGLLGGVFFVTPPILENDFKFHYYLSKSLKPPARLLTISTPWPVMVGPSDQRWKQLFVMNLSNPGSAKKKTQMPNFGSKFFFNFGSKVLMENGHVTCTVVFF